VYLWGALEGLNKSDTLEDLPSSSTAGAPSSKALEQARGQRSVSTP